LPIVESKRKVKSLKFNIDWAGTKHSIEYVSSAVLHGLYIDIWIVIDHRQPGEALEVMIGRLSYSGRRKHTTC
jgi:hypothetical protein